MPFASRALAPGLRRRVLTSGRHRRAGWTFLEMLVVLALIGLLAGLAVYQGRPSRAHTVDEAARLFAHRLVTVRAEAVMQSGDAQVYIDTTGGRYVAQHVLVDQDTSGVQPSDWSALPATVRFSAGTATVGPLGDTPAAAVSTTHVHCVATGDCDLGGVPVATFYLSDRDTPTIVRAVTIATTGAFRVYRFTGAQWQ